MKPQSRDTSAKTWCPVEKRDYLDHDPTFCWRCLRAEVAALQCAHQLGEEDASREALRIFENARADPAPEDDGGTDWFLTAEAMAEALGWLAPPRPVFPAGTCPADGSELVRAPSGNYVTCRAHGHPWRRR